MPILQKLIERRYTLKDAVRALNAGYETHTGISVNENQALNLTVVYACITLIADIFAENRKILYRRLQPRGRERAVNHHLYPLLHESPNTEMDAFTFDQTRMGHVLGWGNSYVEIDWDMSNGQVRGLWPLDPSQMRVVREDGVIWYYYKTPDGIEHKLPAWRIWHTPGFGFDGLIGYSPIKKNKQAIALSMAAEEFTARFYSQGSHMGMVASHPGRLTKDGSQNLERSLNNQYAGLGKSHRMMVLEEGMKIEKIGINPVDAEVLGERRFQLSEICRFYRVPPHLVADTEKSTSWGTGIEQQNIGFLIYTIQPWHTRNELSASLKLLGPEERKTYYIEALVDNLLRGDSAARGEFYNKIFQVGGITPNEVREKENFSLSDDPNADKLFVPANMMPIDSAGGNKATDAQQLEDIIRKIAGREKNNLLNAAGKYGVDDFNKWMKDFYRDFPNYIRRQVNGFVDNPEQWTTRYIAHSLETLEGITPEDITVLLEKWETEKLHEM
jgi:HK97 family phage portal protein